MKIKKSELNNMYLELNQRFNKLQSLVYESLKLNVNRRGAKEIIDYFDIATNCFKQTHSLRHIELKLRLMSKYKLSEPNATKYITKMYDKGIILKSESLYILNGQFQYFNNEG